MKNILLLLVFIYTGQINAQCSVNVNPSSITVCSGQCVTLSASGASSYTWNTSGPNTPTINICPPIGMTVYTVTGTTGTCTAVGTVTVIANPPVTVCCGIADSSTCGFNNGGVHGIAVSGGTPPYHYQWYNGGSVIPNDTLSTLSGVGVGTYSITVVDANGCMKVKGPYNVQCATGILKNPEESKQILIHPNPTSDQFFIEANTTDKLNVDLYDVNGRHVFSQSVSDKSNINIATFDEGIYTLTIKTVDRVTNKKLVIVR